jgi:catechol 2,3-dioxygenase-like lactoylglutathione lyase family enzyme
MQIPVSGYAHVRITVSDIDRSRAFYDEVFGFPVAHELPADADAETRERLWFLFGGVIYQLPEGLFGLRPAGPDGDFFDEDRVGLDHISFAVPQHGTLLEVVGALDAKGVAHGGVKDIGNGWILEFRDPDGIALELFAPRN